MKKNLGQLPDSYAILATNLKPKHYWEEVKDIFDHITKFREITVALLLKVTQAETDRHQKANLLRNFAREFPLDWLRGFGS